MDDFGFNSEEQPLFVSLMKIPSIVNMCKMTKIINLMTYVNSSFKFSFNYFRIKIFFASFNLQFWLRGILFHISSIDYNV